jgi:hypothetical protein
VGQFFLHAHGAEEIRAVWGEGFKAQAFQPFSQTRLKHRPFRIGNLDAAVTVNDVFQARKFFA